MKKNILLLLVLASLATLMGCEAEPKPIHYNLDVCEHCHMVITDVRYGTEILTSKGKAFKFDSFECMIDYTKETSVDVGQHLVTSFSTPKQLIDAQNTWVIKCEAMPSPMGRYLTIFEHKHEAQAVLNENGGEILPFSQALEKF